MLRKTIFLLAALCSSIAAMAQLSVSGRVVDTSTKQPLEGVNVRLLSSNKGAVTDAQGQFVLKHLPNRELEIEFTYVGYEPVRLRLSNAATNLQVEMQESLNRLDQVVVTGTGTNRRMADTPVPVSVITAQDIKALNATNFQEALSRLSSSFSFVTTGMGTEIVFGGLPRRYFLVLVNGNRMLNEDVLDRIDVASIKRIEILNSSASTLYGSDAVGGVMNIITEEETNKEVQASSQTRMSSYGRFSQSASVEYTGSQFASFSSYKREQSKGWQLHPNEEKLNKKTKEYEEKPTAKQASTGYYTNLFSQRFSYKPTTCTELFALGSYYTNSTLRSPEAYNYNLFHEDFTYGGGVKHYVTGKSFVEANFSSDNYHSFYRYIKETKQNKVGDRDLRKQSRMYRTNVRGVMAINERHTLSGGAEYLLDKLNSEVNDVNNESLYTVSLFLQEEWSINDYLELSAGMRYINNETFGNHYCPSASLMFKDGGFRARVSFAGGFRTPDMQEIFATSYSSTRDRYIVGNLDLKPEISKNFSLNLEYTNPFFSVSATGFINNISDLIWFKALTPEEAKKLGDFGDSEVQQRTNLNEARIQGVNTGIQITPGLGFYLGGGYSFLHTKDLNTKASLDKTVRHAGYVNAGWGKRWSWYRLDTNINGRAQGKRFSASYDYYSPAYSMWDFHTTQTFYLKDFKALLGLGVENIFDWKDARPYNSQKPYATVDPGRAFYASLTLYFGR